MALKIKVCGMREPENVVQVLESGPDFIGFIFYPGSPRYVGPDAILPKASENTVRVGVFVNESITTMVTLATQHQLNWIQLHGNESPQIALELKQRGFHVIKAISLPVTGTFDFNELAAFEAQVDYFLFDTKTPGFGGSGQRFDWQLLAQYQGNVPFLLSGGLDLNALHAIKAIHHPRFAGVDVNSRMETRPGLKDPELIRQAVQLIHETHAG